MVNNRIVSRFKGELPKEGSDTRISNGPLYPREDVLGVLNDGGVDTIIHWTQKCIDDQQRHELGPEDALRLIEKALKSGRFLNSSWCKQNPKGPWAACDAYSVIERTWVQNAHKEMDFEFYLKFAIAESGAVLLLVSCHPSEERR